MSFYFQQKLVILSDELKSEADFVSEYRSKILKKSNFTILNGWKSEVKYGWQAAGSMCHCTTQLHNRVEIKSLARAGPSSGDRRQMNWLQEQKEDCAKQRKCVSL